MGDGYNVRGVGVCHNVAMEMQGCGHGDARSKSSTIILPLSSRRYRCAVRSGLTRVIRRSESGLEKVHTQNQHGGEVDMPSGRYFAIKFLGIPQDDD